MGTSLFDPNDYDTRARRKKLAALIATNPELARQLKNNPELVKSLVGSDPLFEKWFPSTNIPKLLDTYKYTPEEESRQVEAGRARSLQKLERNPNTISNASEGLPNLTLDEMRQMASGTPDSSMSAQLDAMRSKILGIDSNIKREGDVANTNESRARADSLNVATDLAKQELETKDQEKKDRLAADAIVAQIGENNLYKYISPQVPLEAGKQKLPSGVLAMLQNVPKYKNLIEQQQEDYWHGVQDQRTRELANATRESREENKLDLAVQKRMDLIYTRTGRMVSRDVVKETMQNPRLLKPFENIKESEVPPESKDMWDLAQANKDVMQKTVSSQIKAAHNSLIASNIYKRVFSPPKGYNPNEQDLANLNEEASRAYSQVDGIPAPKWKMQDIKFSRDKIVPDNLSPELEELYGSKEESDPTVLNIARIAETQGDDEATIVQHLVALGKSPEEAKALARRAINVLKKSKSKK